jgi:predicted HAD superfamily hydrolase
VGQRTTKSGPPAQRDAGLWRRDPSLAEIGRALERDKGSVLSLDFFDTTVFRLCRHPTDVFVEVGRQLAARGLLLRPLSGEEFCRMRVAAESQCRSHAVWHKQSAEIALADIYARLAKHVVREPEACAAVEVEAEKLYCCLNPNVKSLVDFALKLGRRVCILSDMYLSRSHIAEIAAHNGLDPGRLTAIATSSDVGCGKGSGDLFRRVLAALEEPPERMHHLGDSEAADVAGGRRAGVHTYHYYRTTDYTEAVFDREGRRLGDRSPRFAPDALRTLALRSCGDDGRGHVEDGAFLLGPVMAGWSDWCVAECERRGIRRVLAFMREGEIVAKLLRASAKAAGADLRIDVAFVSRQSTHLASVGEADLTTIPARIYARTVGEVLTGFGINPEEAGFPPKITRQPINSSEMLQTIARFLTSGKIKAYVEEKSLARRAELLAYLVPLLAGADKVAYVDLGWGGTIQRNIDRALALGGVRVESHGLYLATSAAACNGALDGQNAHGFLDDLGARASFSKLLVRSPEIIEQTMSACIGSTVGYTAQGEPILEQVRADEGEQERRRAVQKGILAYQAIWLDLKAQKLSPRSCAPELAQEIGEAFREHCRAVVHRLIAYPRQEEARRFGAFHHDDNLFSDSRSLIVKPAHEVVLKREGLEGVDAASKAYWPQGVLAIARPRLLDALSGGTEPPVVIGDAGSDDFFDAVRTRYPSVAPEEILGCAAELGEGVRYRFDVRCGACGEPSAHEIEGTLVVDELVACPACGAVRALSHEVVRAHLEARHPALLAGAALETAARLEGVARILARGGPEGGDIPLLALLGNEATVNGLSELAAKHGAGG